VRHASSKVIGSSLAIVLALIVGACSGASSSDEGSSDPVPASVTPGDPIAGAPLYRGVCATCHGADLGGVEGLGRPLLPSSFITDQSDDELVDFIIEGRPIDHPDNITGVAMLPRGGNPSLSDRDIADIVAYIKAQQ
jgi:disulfide bond formation protein DsbB